jgi:hypothetical protein
VADVDLLLLRLPASSTSSVILWLFRVQRRQQSRRLYGDGTKMRFQKPLIEKVEMHEAAYMPYLTWDTRARLSALVCACEKAFFEVALRVPIGRTS